MAFFLQRFVAVAQPFHNIHRLLPRHVPDLVQFSQKRGDDNHAAGSHEHPLQIHRCIAEKAMAFRIKIHGEQDHLRRAYDACGKIKETGTDYEPGQQQHLRIGYGQKTAGSDQHAHKQKRAQRSDDDSLFVFLCFIILFLFDDLKRQYDYLSLKDRTPSEERPQIDKKKGSVSGLCYPLKVL